METKTIKTKIGAALALTLLFGGAAAAGAYEIKDVKAGDRGDFVLEPAKLEVSLDPGAAVTRELNIINRLGETRKFTIDIEDFTGTKTGEKAVVLLGEEKGPYSLKDYLKPEVREFTLKSGEKMILPITVSVPADAEPGGRYGSVLVATSPAEEAGGEGAGAKGGTKIISRLGALFFVRVNGPVEEKGELKEFLPDKPAKKVYYDRNGPRGFKLAFRNDGSVHLNPYGVIEISNLAGMTVDKIEVKPFFAMPGSLRNRYIEWGDKTLMGRYKATALINRGYGDLVDEKSFVFWVIPWKIILGVFAAIFFIVLVVRLFFSRFEIKRKA